jgi:hypothetical protein
MPLVAISVCCHRSLPQWCCICSRFICVTKFVLLCYCWVTELFSSTWFTFLNGCHRCNGILLLHQCDPKSWSGVAVSKLLSCHSFDAILLLPTFLLIVKGTPLPVMRFCYHRLSALLWSLCIASLSPPFWCSCCCVISTVLFLLQCYFYCCFVVRASQFIHAIWCNLRRGLLFIIGHFTLL